MRRVSISFLIAFILLFSFVSFAGDLPESLLNSPTAQVYIGELKKVYDDESVVFTQKVKIKGDFTKDKEIRYYKYVFDGGFEIGKSYLIGDDTAVSMGDAWILHISGEDLRTLEIGEDYDMAKRMQQYINDGSFEKSEEELNNSEAVKVSETQTSETQITEAKAAQSGEEAGLGVEPKEENGQTEGGKNNVLIYAIVIGFVAAIGYAALRIRAKYKNRG
ncbi:MAG: hypothetical protein D8H95_18230 [Lachnospiraceae bacterium]|nr:MAG: hypothetical protein D8H95_18230 [Lachnospiraceae bacterium]